MTRFVLAVAATVSCSLGARAGILPSFDGADCARRASHVVVVNADGKVLESWRGDLQPNDRIPLRDFGLTLAYDVREPFGVKAAGPKKVTGNRLVLFLKRGGPNYHPERVEFVGSWGAANRWGRFEVSAAWLEEGHAFALAQWINPGPQEMSRHGTEAELKKTVRDVDATVREAFARARAEKDVGKRATTLAGIVHSYPGFSADAFGGLEWCGADALPELRTIVKKERTGYPEVVAALGLMAKVGPPARDDLVAACGVHVRHFEDQARHFEHFGRLDYDGENMHRQLLAATSNEAAFAGLTADQAKALQAVHDLWVAHPVLSKIGEKGDRIPDRLARVLARQK